MLFVATLVQRLKALPTFRQQKDRRSGGLFVLSKCSLQYLLAYGACIHPIMIYVRLRIWIGVSVRRIVKRDLADFGKLSSIVAIYGAPAKSFNRPNIISSHLGESSLITNRYECFASTSVRMPVPNTAVLAVGRVLRVI